MNLMKRALLLAFIFMLAGCVTMKASSQKNPAFAKRIDSVLIVTQTPEDVFDVHGLVKSQARYYTRMFPALSAKLATESVKSDVLIMDKLALNAQDTMQAKAKQTGANYILKVEVAKIEKIRTDLGVLQRYDISAHLNDAVTNEAIWAGSVKGQHLYDFTVEEYMKNIAGKIVETMKADKLL
jgi:hypothetical protein